MTSIFLTPQAITQDNLDVVLDADWVSQEDLCQGVKPGTVDVCG
jgi:D-xylose transport system substrate-binding protein